MTSRAREPRDRVARNINVDDDDAPLNYSAAPQRSKDERSHLSQEEQFIILAKRLDDELMPSQCWRIDASRTWVLLYYIYDDDDDDDDSALL